MYKRQGINTETLDGNQQGIDAAKKLLATKGASYRNIYFASGSEGDITPVIHGTYVSFSNLLRFGYRTFFRIVCYPYI